MKEHLCSPPEPLSTGKTLRDCIFVAYRTMDFRLPFFHLFNPASFKISIWPLLKTTVLEQLLDRDHSIHDWNASNDLKKEKDGFVGCILGLWGVRVQPFVSLLSLIVEARNCSGFIIEFHVSTGSASVREGSPECTWSWRMFPLYLHIKFDTHANAMYRLKCFLSLMVHVVRPLHYSAISHPLLRALYIDGDAYKFVH